MKQVYEVAVADDEMAVTQLIAQHIDKLPGFHTAACLYDGRTARELLARQPVDILVSDIRMPEMDGLELARWMAAHAPGCALILISAYSEFEYAKQAIALGVVDYLLKPISLRELDAALMRTAHKLQQERDDFHAESAIATQEETAFFADLTAGRLSQTEEFLSRLSALPALEAWKEAAGVILTLQIERATRPEDGEPFHWKLARLLEKEWLKAFVWPLEGRVGEADFLALGGTFVDETRLNSRCRRYLGVRVQCRVRYAFQRFSQINGCPLFAPKPECEKTGAPVIQQIMNYIRLHLAEDMDRRTVAEAFFFEPTYFSKFFKKEAGMLYHEYVRKARMDAAIELLRCNMPVNEIYDRVGYRDRKLFNAAFKQYTGMSPTAYRRRYFTPERAEGNDKE